MKNLIFYKKRKISDTKANQPLEIKLIGFMYSKQWVKKQRFIIYSKYSKSQEINVKTTKIMKLLWESLDLQCFKTE